MSRAYLCSLAGFQVTTIGRFWVTAEGLKAPHLMKDVYQGAQYVNGVPVNQVTEEKAA